MMAATPASWNSPTSSTAVSWDDFGPALDGDQAVARVDADGDLARMATRGLPHQAGVANGGRADDNTRNALSQPAVDRAHVADAAAELDRHPRQGRQNLFDGLRVHRLAGEGPVEIDDMQIFKALTFESQGLRGRIVVENGGERHVAMDQPDALPALEIDCRKKDHGRHLRKLEISRRPKFWLFSG